MVCSEGARGETVHGSLLPVCSARLHSASLNSHSLKPRCALPSGIFDTDGSGAVDAAEFAARDGLAKTIIASLSSF